eukprot:GHVO01020480.1.p1 GENE.GHVO01020480.1~~GHVO01020480.1.p1  ORF type:complete len:403 (+),score=71.14 GHVO01020480.1:92-1300(+)
MSKRNAGSELNADNWDQEEEEDEEPGIFKQADTDKMAKRQVLKAKRRIGSSQDTTDGPKAFAGFAGFTSFKPAEQRTTTMSSSLFSGTSPKSSATTSIFGSSASSAANASPLKPVSNGHPSKSPQKSAYMQQLKALNESVSQWIQKHVASNPYCILTPIFKDYEKHLEEISQKHPESKSPEKKIEEEKKEEKEEKKEIETEKTEEVKKPEVSSGFSFGAKSSGSVFGSSSPSTTGFSFGATSNPIAPAAPSGGFSFAVSKPVGPATTATGATEEEEYVPPKPEVSQVTEDDATYTKKCKLFYQKDGSWKDKGVGFVYLKPCGEKTQLLIRADTNLGNVLLNIILSSSIPMSRQGKNNVTLICVPNPALDEKDDSSKPVSMLIRVKTADDADELLEKLKEAKE